MGRGQEVVVTNDGATILKSLYVDNPAAKVLVGELPVSRLDPQHEHQVLQSKFIYPTVTKSYQVLAG